MTAELGPFGSFIGFDVVEWKPGFARVTMTVKPFMLNRSGVLHGGMIVALLDAAAGYAGTYCEVPGNVRHGVTLSLSTSFVGQARSGLITADARVVGGGRNVFFVRVDVTDDTGAPLAIGDCTYKYRSNSVDPKGFRPEALSSADQSQLR